MLLKGKKILITGVANDWSMAWAIARRAHDEGAEIAMPYAMPNLEKRVRPLAESIGAKFVQECNVQNDEQMDSLFNNIEREWGKLDGMLHAIAFSDKNELTGRYADTTRANFKNTMDVSVYSLVDLTRRASKLMTDGGSIVTLTYYGGEKSVPNYNVMGVAKSALDSSVRYLASDLGRDKIRINAISAGPIMTLASSGVGGMKTMLRLGSEKEQVAVVADQHGTPTWAADLARTILHILQNTDIKNTHGLEIFHYTDEGECTWYEFASAIMQMGGKKCQVMPISTDEYPASCRRPAYSVLDKTKIKERFGLEIPLWDDSLQRMLAELDKRDSCC